MRKKNVIRSLTSKLCKGRNLRKAAVWRVSETVMEDKILPAVVPFVLLFFVVSAGSMSGK